MPEIPTLLRVAMFLHLGLYDDSTVGDPYAIILLHGYDQPKKPGVPTPKGSKTRATGSFKANTVSVDVNANRK